MFSGLSIFISISSSSITGRVWTGLKRMAATGRILLKVLFCSLVVVILPRKACKLLRFQTFLFVSFDDKSIWSHSARGLFYSFSYPIKPTARDRKKERGGRFRYSIGNITIISRGFYHLTRSTTQHEIGCSVVGKEPRTVARMK